MPDEQYLEELMSQYGDKILRLCYLYLRDYQLAEDAAQETFINAMKSYKSFENRSDVKTWLVRITINSCKNIIRSRWFQIMQNNLENPLEKLSDDFSEITLEKISVSEAVMKLNMTDRQIILLYYYQNLPVKEISQMTGKKENTIIQRINRARERLKKILLEEGYEPV